MPDTEKKMDYLDPPGRGPPNWKIPLALRDEVEMMFLIQFLADFVPNNPSKMAENGHFSQFWGSQKNARSLKKEVSRSIGRTWFNLSSKGSQSPALGEWIWTAAVQIWLADITVDRPGEGVC